MFDWREVMLVTGLLILAVALASLVLTLAFTVSPATFLVQPGVMPGYWQHELHHSRRHR